MIGLDNALKSAVMGLAAKPKMDRLSRATKDFEAILIKDMLTTMRRTMPNLSESSHSAKLMRDMADQAMAEAASKRGDFGVAKQMYDRVAPSALRQEYHRLQRLLNEGGLEIPSATNRTV
jgi:Rod binding domain-containing protein